MRRGSVETQIPEQGLEPTGPDRAPRWRRLGLLSTLIGLGLVLLVLGATLLADLVSGPSPLDVPPGQPVTVTVANGSSARSIAATMEAAGVAAAGEIRDEITVRGAEGQLKAGNYLLETGMTAAALVDLLVAGPNAPIEGGVTIGEGWTVEEIVAALAAHTGRDVAEFRSALVDGSVTSPYLPEQLPPGVEPLAAWEGLLYPARYQVDASEPVATVLQRLADETVDRVESTDWTGVESMGLTRYEALVVASLIEREAGIEEDRPLIASVIYNRLAAGMRLQIDATVIYALGENPGRVLAEHLDVDSPYNTYAVDGLPPTPIGTFRQSSLDAAADPADTSYLFYVLVSTDGRHGFSETYEEHQAKVQQAREDGVLP